MSSIFFEFAFRVVWTIICRVPRKAALPPRELAICRRFETFRRGTKIPRAVFARTVGFVPERLATYEAGRSPLRYDAFRAINAHFPLNPQWLVTGRGQRLLDPPFDDRAFRARIDGRELLSAAYDRELAPHFDALEEAVVEAWVGSDGLLGRLADFNEALEDAATREKLPTHLLERIEEVLDALHAAVRETLLARKPVASTRRGGTPASPPKPRK